MTAYAGQTSTKNPIVNSNLNNDSSTLADSRKGDNTGVDSPIQDHTRRVHSHTTILDRSSSTQQATGVPQPLCEKRTAEKNQPREKFSAISASGKNLPTRPCAHWQRSGPAPTFKTLKFSGRLAQTVVNPSIDIPAIMNALFESSTPDASASPSASSTATPRISATGPNTQQANPNSSPAPSDSPASSPQAHQYSTPSTAATTDAMEIDTSANAQPSARSDVRPDVDSDGESIPDLTDRANVMDDNSAASATSAPVASQSSTTTNTAAPTLSPATNTAAPTPTPHGEQQANVTTSANINNPYKKTPAVTSPSYNHGTKPEQPPNATKHTPNDDGTTGRNSRSGQSTATSSSVQTDFRSRVHCPWSIYT